MNYAHPNYLVSVDQLAELSAEQDRLRVFDCTVFLHPDPPRYRVESGAASFEEGHIPGAGFLDLTGNLSDSSSQFGFTLPSPEALAGAFGQAGIGDDHQVVLYSAGHVMWATRVWWMLHSLGHASVSVLDGGLRAWSERDLPLSTQPSDYPEASLSLRFDADRWAGRDAVLVANDDSATCTVNALSEEVHAGTSQLDYGRKGHIAGSRNVPYDELMDAGRFRTADEVHARLAEKGLFDASRVICYCGGGISATIDAFALSMLDHPSVAVYDGSMSEWASDASLPMETGLDSVS